MHRPQRNAALVVLACAAVLACSGGGGGPPEPLPPIPEGMLLAPEDWAALPRPGRDAECAPGSPCASAWGNILDWAERWDDPGVFPDLAEASGDDSDHDVIVLACALAWRGSDDDAWRERARLSIEAAVFTPYSTAGVSALRPGRNLLSYVLAASTIELAVLDPVLDGQFRAWIEKMAERDLWVGEGVTQPGTFRAYHERRPNNVGAVVGAARIAVDMYLGGDVHARHVVEAQRVCRGFLGDDAAYEFPDAAFGGPRNDHSWQMDPRPGRKEGIAPPGATLPAPPGLGLALLDLDGCLPEEMRRLGDLDCTDCGLVPSIHCFNRADALDGGAPPGIGATNYPWESLQGLVMQAWLLRRCGYESFAWGDAAIERALRFLYVTYGLRAQDTWSDATQADDPRCCSGANSRAQADDTWVPHIVRAIQGSPFLDDSALVHGGRPGKNCGFADWWTLGLRAEERAAEAADSAMSAPPGAERSAR
jgi:hypothetical protein